MRRTNRTRVHWYANDPPGGRCAAAALLRLALRVGFEFRPDVVISLHISAMPAARVLGRTVSSRSMVMHAKEVTQQPALARAAAGWADAITCVSGFSRSLALSAGAEEARISVIHPGVRA